MFEMMRAAFLAGLSLFMLASSVALAEAPSPSKDYESEIRKLEQKSVPEPGGILFVGSSSIRLWDTKASFPDLQIANRGFGGSQLCDSVYYFDRLVLPLKPSLIVLYAGDNDIASGKSPCRIYEDFRLFVSRVHTDLPGTRVVYLSIKPSLKRWAMLSRIRAANALMKMECEGDPLLTYVDLDTPMIGPDGKPPEDLFAKDGLHLSSKGYALWKEHLLPHLQTASSAN